jgi:hypothetical protein
MYLKGRFIVGFTTLPNSSRAPCTGGGQSYVEWSVSQGEGKGQSQAKGWCPCAPKNAPETRAAGENTA